MSLTDATEGTAAQQMGQHLRRVREHNRLTADVVAARLRMPKSLVLSLEQGDWSRLGAPVFVRGHLRSYAHLLGVELDGLDEITALPTPVAPMIRIGRGQKIFGRLGTQIVYVVITALIALPIWMAARHHLSAPGPAMADALDLPGVDPGVDTPQPLPQPLPEHEEDFDGELAAIPAPASPPRPLTTVASLLPPSPQPSASASASDITLHLNQDSWVKLYAPNGRTLEQSLLKAGETRRFRPGQLGRVVIGNAAGVTMKIGDKIQDLTAWQRANVARFAVSSDGVLGPITD